MAKKKSQTKKKETTKVEEPKVEIKVEEKVKEKVEEEMVTILFLDTYTPTTRGEIENDIVKIKQKINEIIGLL